MVFKAGDSNAARVEETQESANDTELKHEINSALQKKESLGMLDLMQELGIEANIEEDQSSALSKLHAENVAKDLSRWKEKSRRLGDMENSFTGRITFDELSLIKDEYSLPHWNPHINLLRPGEGEASKAPQSLSSRGRDEEPSVDRLSSEQLRILPSNSETWTFCIQRTISTLKIGKLGPLLSTKENTRGK